MTGIIGKRLVGNSLKINPLSTENTVSLPIIKEKSDFMV